jgi:hypothetical protein
MRVTLKRQLNDDEKNYILKMHGRKFFATGHEIPAGEELHYDHIQSLAELRRALPSMRLGQLIANIATVARGAVPGAVWEAADDELLKAVRWQLRQLSERPTPSGFACHCWGKGLFAKACCIRC